MLHFGYIEDWINGILIVGFVEASRLAKCFVLRQLNPRLLPIFALLSIYSFTYCYNGKHWCVIV